MNMCLKHTAHIGTLFAFINFESRQDDEQYEARDAH